MPESWEVASEEEWEEIQRGILRSFATGGSFIQQAIGKALGVEPLRQPTPSPAPAPSPREEFIERKRAEVPSVTWGRPPGERELAEQKKAEEIAAGYKYPGLTGMLLEPTLPEEHKGFIPGVPYIPIPEPIRRQTSPLGLAFLGKWPGPMAAMAGGEIAGGEIAERVAGEEARPWGELGGGLAGLAAPAALPALGRATQAGVQRAAPAVRRLAVEEAGGGLLGREPLSQAEKAILRRLRAGRVQMNALEDAVAQETGIDAWKVITARHRLQTRGLVQNDAEFNTFLTPKGQKLLESGLPLEKVEGLKPKPSAPKPAALIEAGGPKPKVPMPVKAPTFKEALMELRQQRAEEKLVPFIKAVKGILPKRAQALHQHRQRQAGTLDGIWKRAERGEITPEQAEAMHFSSLKGEVDFPELQALGEAITSQDMHALKLSIVKRAETAGLGRYEIGNAIKALEQLKSQGQLAPHQADLLTRIFGEGVGEALAGLEPAQAKFLGEIWEVLGIPRGVQAAFDISFPLRQGIMLGPRHPQIWGKGTERAFKGFINPKWADAENAMILREQAEGLLPRTLDITRPGVGAFAERAEPFISKYLRKIPGIWRSEASFNVAGNRMRRDLSLSYAKRWSKHAGRTLTETEMDELGRVVNFLTGRGPVPRQLAYTLSQILYSPRFLTSKPAFLVKMVTNAKSNPYLSRMMAEELVAFVGTGVGLLSLLKYSGAAEVEINPQSSDFGKIKIGKMRFDIWGGGQQLVRYTAQMITGQRKTLGTGELVDAERKWVAARLAMSKLAPQAGIPLDLWRGESYMGEEIEPSPEAIKTQIWNRLGPLAAQDIIEAVREEGAKGLISLPALLGVGVLTFETPGEKIVKLAKDKHGVDWVKLGKTERLRLEDQDPEIAAARQEQLEAAAKWGAAAGLELRQEHAEFEGNLAEYLQRPDMTLSEAASQYRDYVQKQAAKNEERWKDAPESDPRSELDRKIDEFYAEEYPTWGTDAEKDAWYQGRAAMRAADPDLDAALLDLAVLRFKDSTVREFVTRYEEAEAVRHQYYQIPRFTPLSPEEGNRVSDILREAQSLVQLGKAGGIRGAIYMIVERDGIPDKLAYVALYPQRFQNPERQQFRHEHADELAIFESLPVDALEGLVVD